MTNQDYFLSWFNDFLTIPKFAEYYGFSFKRAELVLLKGYAMHESQFGPIVFDVMEEK